MVFCHNPYELSKACAVERACCFTHKSDGSVRVRVLGEPGVTYSVEATTDFERWTLVGTSVAPSPSGVLELQDLATQGLNAKFYRAYSLR